MHLNILDHVLDSVDSSVDIKFSVWRDDDPKLIGTNREFYVRAVASIEDVFSVSSKLENYEKVFVVERSSMERCMIELSKKIEAWALGEKKRAVNVAEVTELAKLAKHYSETNFNDDLINFPNSKLHVWCKFPPQQQSQQQQQQQKQQQQQQQMNQTTKSRLFPMLSWQRSTKTLQTWVSVKMTGGRKRM